MYLRLSKCVFVYLDRSDHSPFVYKSSTLHPLRKIEQWRLKLEEVDAELGLRLEDSSRLQAAIGKSPLRPVLRTQRYSQTRRFLIQRRDKSPGDSEHLARAKSVPRVVMYKKTPM